MLVFLLKSGATRLEVLEWMKSVPLLFYFCLLVKGERAISMNALRSRPYFMVCQCS